MFARARLGIILAFVMLVPALSSARTGLPLNKSEEPSIFFPGTYFFHKGCEYYKRGDKAFALSMWKVAAYWGQKAAQYNLGIA